MHRITLNPEKFEIAQVKFCRYVVGRNGIASDHNKLNAIAEFPTPTNITDLHSFLCMVHQLDNFSADIASASETLRGLLKKGFVFDWTADHNKAFNVVKNIRVATNRGPF